MGGQNSKLRVKFDEGNTVVVLISPKRTVHDATIKAVQKYKKSTGKDVSVSGLKVRGNLLRPAPSHVTPAKESAFRDQVAVNYCILLSEREGLHLGG